MYTVIRFVRVSPKFGTYTVVSVNETLLEDKMCTSLSNLLILSSTSVPVILTTGESAKFSTNMKETDYSVSAVLLNALL